MEPGLARVDDQRIGAGGDDAAGQRIQGRFRILIVDADLRRGRLHKYLGIDAGPGLSEMLSNDAQPEDAFIHMKGLENLTFLPAGKTPHNPAELLGSAKFRNLLSQLKEKYDYVIIDTPPVIPVTDAGLIGAQTETP